MNKKIARSLLAIAATAFVGAGATYASFTSNSLTMYGNSISTGQASVKLCQANAGNNWTTSITPNLNLAGMIPGEERDMTGSIPIYLGNDNGRLTSAIDPGTCTAYLDPASVSSTSLRFVPNVVFASETCPDPLPSNLKIRFDIKGTDTGYKTMNAWASNATANDPTFAPGEVGQIKAYAQLSTTTAAQDARCNFAITLTAKQPTS